MSGKTKKMKVVITAENNPVSPEGLARLRESYDSVQKVPPVDWRASKEAAASPDEDEDCGGPDPKK